MKREPGAPIVVGLLAHHRHDDLERCVLLPWGRRRLALCARCLGLYPTLLAALGLQLALDSPLLPWDWLIVLVGVAPLLADWAAARLAWSPGSNGRRLASGALGGVGLGRAFYLYFRHPGSEVFWVTLLGVAIVFVAVELVRALGLKNLS